MRLCILALAVSMAFAAGCQRQAPEPPTTASSGASTTPNLKTGPTGDRIPLPPSTGSDTSGAQAKPDPGDANDHSTPQHDAKNKKNGD